MLNLSVFSFVVLSISAVSCGISGSDAATEAAKAAVPADPSSARFTKENIVFGDGTQVEKMCMACKIMGDEVRQHYEDAIVKLKDYVRTLPVCNSILSGHIPGFSASPLCDTIVGMSRKFLDKEAENGANKIMEKCSKNLPCLLEPAKSALLGTALELYNTCFKAFKG